MLLFCVLVIVVDYLKLPQLLYNDICQMARLACISKMPAPGKAIEYSQLWLTLHRYVDSPPPSLNDCDASQPINCLVFQSQLPCSSRYMGYLYTIITFTMLLATPDTAIKSHASVRARRSSVK